jgi:hypothetical protein
MLVQNNTFKLIKMNGSVARWCYVELFGLGARENVGAIILRHQFARASQLQRAECGLLGLPYVKCNWEWELVYRVACPRPLTFGQTRDYQAHTFGPGI